MIQEDYVSFGTAKLLKEKGFTEWCFKCYGVAVLHNGADISFDEECDLKNEGRGDEIEYVEGGRLYDYGCNNRDKDAKVWAAPTLWVAMKWLREVHHYYIQVMLDSWALGSHTGYYIVIQKTDSNFEMMLQDVREIVFYDTPEEAAEDAIMYIVENLI